MRPRIRIITTGGTIASRDTADGAIAAVRGEELLEAVPGLDDEAQVETVDAGLVNSWDMTPALVSHVIDLIRAAHTDSIDAVVVTHGTDTLEETAFMLALAALPIPIVMTGAMRSASDPTPDGPANLRAAVRLAASPISPALDVCVVLGDEAHPARDVRKTHSTARSTFASPGLGPAATFDEEGLYLVRRGHALPPLPELTAATIAEMEHHWVPIIPSALGLQVRLVEAALRQGPAALVLEATGAGNVPAAWRPAIDGALDAGVPVVLTSRTAAGRVTPIYGGAGGGRSLVEAGVLPAADLPAAKARLATLAALATGGPEGVRNWFRELTAAA